MQDKTDQNVTATTPTTTTTITTTAPGAPVLPIVDTSEKTINAESSKIKCPSYFGFSEEQLQKMAWNTANFTTVAGITSASIVAVQSPAKTFLVNLSKEGTFIPSYAGGVLGFFRALYVGTAASFSGSAVRTVYVTGAKKGGVKQSNEMAEGMSVEEGMIKEEGFQPKVNKMSFGYVGAIAVGDTLVTQISDSISGLKKAGVSGFNWYTTHNAYQLMTTGLMVRYSTSMVNMGSLCVLESLIADKLPIENHQTRHFMSGAISGAAAAFVSQPLAMLREKGLLGATVSNGKVTIPSTYSVIKDLTQMYKSNPKEALKSFAKLSMKQIPLRAGLTSVIFSLVSGVGDTLGEEPLKKILPQKYIPSFAKNTQGFFGGNTATPTIDAPVVPKKDDAEKVSPNHI